MPLRPEYSVLNFVLAASGVNVNLNADDVSETYELLDFERKEYSNTYLQNLPNDDGTYPIFQKNILGKDIQVQFVGCGTTSVRNILPDDANVPNILQRWTLRTYNIKGADSSPSAVDALLTISRDHKRREDVFKSYLKRFELKLSYQYIINLRNESFNYLTASGLTLTGPSISESNVIVQELNEGYKYWNPRSNTTVIKDWSAKISAYTLLDSQTVF